MYSILLILFLWLSGQKYFLFILAEFVINTGCVINNEKSDDTMIQKIMTREYIKYRMLKIQIKFPYYEILVIDLKIGNYVFSKIN